MKVKVEYKNGSTHSEIVTDGFFQTHIDPKTQKPITVPKKARQIAYGNGVDPFVISVIKDGITIFNEIIKENTPHKPLKQFKMYKSLAELQELVA